MDPVSNSVSFIAGLLKRYDFGEEQALVTAHEIINGLTNSGEMVFRGQTGTVDAAAARATALSEVCALAKHVPYLQDAKSIVGAAATFTDFLMGKTPAD